MEIVQGLLRVKRIREELRQRELSRARQELDLAARELLEQQQRQRDRQLEREQRESSLYADVMSRVVVPRELDDLHWEIKAMAQQAQDDAQAVEQAQQQRDQQREAVSAASQAWRAAARSRDKFLDLQRRELAQRALDEEAQADAELEDRPHHRPGGELAAAHGEG
jgi:type III secretion protein O